MAAKKKTVKKKPPAKKNVPKKKTVKKKPAAKRAPSKYFHFDDDSFSQQCEKMAPERKAYATEVSLKALIKQVMTLNLPGSIVEELKKKKINIHDKEVMPAIIARLAVQALKGDVKAAKELFDRGFGRPEQSVEVKKTQTIIFDNDEIGL